MRNRLIYFTGGIIFLTAFAWFSREVVRENFNDIDLALTVKLQDNIPSSLDNYWQFVTLGGNPVITIAIVGLLTLWQIVKGKTIWRKLAALAIPASFFFVALAEIYGKSAVPHASPYFFLLKNPGEFAFPKYYTPSEFSYPSGHAARAVFIALTTWFLFTPKKVRYKILAGALLAGYTVLVSLSQIYLGHHWFSDVLGGSLIAAALALLTVGFCKH